MTNVDLPRDLLSSEEIGDAVRGPHCPEPEQFLAQEWADISAARQLEINRHVVDCAACQVERRLAQAFYEAAGPRREAVAPLHRRAIGWQRTAAAVAGVFAVGLSIWLLRAPSIPDLPPRSDAPRISRGAGIELLAPLGRQSGGPPVFQWSEVDGAARYRLRVIDVSGAEVFTRIVAAPPLADVQAPRRSEVQWRWEVLALDANDQLLSASTVGVYSY